MIITCRACQGRKLVSPLGGMPLPCAICNGVGFIDTKPATRLPTPLEELPSNPSPDITLQKEPATEDLLKKSLMTDLNKKKSFKKLKIKEALKNVGVKPLSSNL